MSTPEKDSKLASEVARQKKMALRSGAGLAWGLLGASLIAGVVVGVGAWFIQRPMDRDDAHRNFAVGLGLATFCFGLMLIRIVFPKMATTKKRKLFWQIPVLLIVGLTAIELWNPGWLMSLPVLREVKVHWYAMRLGNDDPTIQVSAAWALGEMGPKAKGAVPALIAALDSSHSEVRDLAVRALGNIGPDAQAAVESLIRLATAENSGFLEAQSASPWHETQIVNIASSIGKPPRVVLRAVLLPFRLPEGFVPIYEVKLNASEALGKIGEPGVAPLMTGLQDKNPSVREHAAESLGRILLVVPDPKLAQKAMQPLIKALQDEDVRVREAAAMAMPGIVPAMKDPETRATVAKALIRAMKDRGVTPYATGALLKIAEAGLEPLISAFEEEDTPVRPVVPSVEDPESGATMPERLIGIMADKEEMHRIGAEALRQIGQPALEPLINALQDEDVRMRRAAAMAMQRVLPVVNPQIRARAVAPLIRAMKDADREVRGYAPVALCTIGDAALEPLLRVVLQEDTVERALSATAALSEITRDGKDRRRIVEALIEQLQDEENNAAVREQAAAALGQFLWRVRDHANSPTAVASLLKALQDDSHEMRMRAAISLDLIFDSTARPEMTRKTIQDLCTALQDDSPNVRQFIASALGGALSTGAEPGFQQRATESLFSRLEDPKESDFVRDEALEALGRIISASKSVESARMVVPLLIRALEDKRQSYEGIHLRSHASEALGRVVSAVADPELARNAVPPLITALQDKDPSVREHAAKSLGRIFAASPDPELAETAMQPLLAALEDAKWPYHRNYLAWALIQIGTKKAKDAVRKAGFDPDRPPSLPTEGY